MTVGFNLKCGEYTYSSYSSYAHKMYLKNTKLRVTSSVLCSWVRLKTPWLSATRSCCQNTQKLRSSPLVLCQTTLNMSQSDYCMLHVLLVAGQACLRAFSLSTGFCLLLRAKPSFCWVSLPRKSFVLRPWLTGSVSISPSQLSTSLFQRVEELKQK